MRMLLRLHKRREASDGTNSELVRTNILSISQQCTRIGELEKGGMCEILLHESHWTCEIQLAATIIFAEEKHRLFQLCVDI